MITTKDLCKIISNKMAKDIGKSLVRNSFPPHIVEQLCDAIDGNDSVEKYYHILTVYNEWLMEQQCQQYYIQHYLQVAFKIGK